MREKYVFEKYPEWMRLGYYGNEDKPDENITDCNDSFNIRVSPEAAEELVTRHNDILQVLAKLADAFDKANPEAFKAFWYGGK